MDIDASAFNTTHNIEGVIRIPNELYDSIDGSLTRFTHFNLEFCGNRIGATYALPRILTHGYFRSEGDERPPTLSFDDIYVARCVSVREHVPYSAIHEKDFRYAMRLIGDADSLKKEMLFRYGVSMPLLTKKDIISRGVSITTLRILKRHENLN